MRLTVFICLAAVYSLSSCGIRNDKDILPEEKMQSVIWKLIQADVYTSEYLSKDSGVNASLGNAKLQKEIFEKENITKKQFQESYDYYVAHPAMMKNIFDTVLKRNVHERKRRITDTLKNIKNE